MPPVGIWRLSTNKGGASPAAPLSTHFFFNFYPPRCGDGPDRAMARKVAVPEDAFCGVQRCGPRHQEEETAMEYYAGIDVSLEASSVCVVDGSGRILREAKVASEPDALALFFRELNCAVTRIGIEACPLSQWLHAGLRRQVLRWCFWRCVTSRRRSLRWR